MTWGMVVGRFMPLHTGHLALIRTARALVDHLTIVICWQASDDVPGAIRLQWMLEMFPSVRVVGLESPSPHDVFGAQTETAILIEQLGELHPDRLDKLFASDRGHADIAAGLNARFVLIDPDHQAVPISSVAARADPLAHWRFLPPAVRPRYGPTICLHGPESTGKTTLAPLLARHFDTLYVPEYGRTYCEQYGLSLGMDDLVTIGRTHHAMTQALLRQCNQRLILDTDPLMTAVWADMLFGSRDPWFDAFEGTADLYLLLDIDVPWVDDGTRFFGDAPKRQLFFDLSRAELERRKLAYVVIGGPVEDRFARSVEAIANARL